MKTFVKLAMVGIFYLLWEFFSGGVELVQAGGSYSVNERITATRTCRSRTPSCDGRGGRGDLGDTLRGAAVVIRALGPLISDTYPARGRVVVVSRPAPMPRRPISSYPIQGEEGIYVSGSNLAKGAVEELLLEKGKRVLTQKHGNWGMELRVTERSFQNKVIVTAELVDLYSRELLSRSEGRSEFVEKDSLSKSDAVAAAAKVAVDNLRNL